MKNVLIKENNTTTWTEYIWKEFTREGLACQTGYRRRFLTVVSLNPLKVPVVSFSKKFHLFCSLYWVVPRTDSSVINCFNPIITKIFCINHFTDYIHILAYFVCLCIFNFITKTFQTITALFRYVILYYFQFHFQLLILVTSVQTLVKLSQNKNNFNWELSLTVWTFC